MHEHANKEHRKKRVTNKELFNSIQMQTWFKGRRE
jgi:hypothetical protein